MRKVKILFGMIFMLLAISGASLVSTAATIELPITVDEDYTMAKELLDEINKARVNTFSLHELQMDAQLQEIAMLRAAELAVGCAHYRPFDYPTMVQDEYRNIKRENVAAGQGSAPVVYTDWAGSAGHAPVMHDKDAYSCGIGCILYEGTRYWVLVTSADQASSPATITGIKKGVNRSIKTETSRIQFYMWDGYFNHNGSEQSYAGSFVYFGTNTQAGIFISNLYDQSISIGCRVPASMLTYSTTTPEILSVSAGGVVTPKCTGSGSITVALKSNPEVKTDVPVDVKSNTLYQRPTITLSSTSFLYNGQPVKPGVTVTDCFGNKMVEGRDYTLEFLNNDASGTGSVKVFMAGNYHNPAIGNFDFYTVRFSIQPNPDIPDPAPDTGGEEAPPKETETEPDNRVMTVELSKTSYTYTGSECKPDVTVYVDGKKIAASGYSVTYKDNINAGTATVTVKGKGDYKGLSAKATFKINPKKDTDSDNPSKETEKPAEKETEQPAEKETEAETDNRVMTVELSKTSYTYTGSECKPDVTVYVDGKKIAASGYSVTYKDNVNAGTATVTVKGKGDYKGLSAKATFKINPKKEMVMSVTVPKASYDYTGNAITPGVTVSVNGEKIGASGYDVVYKNNKEPGTATVTVTGKGDYKGASAKTTFKIVKKEEPPKEESPETEAPNISKEDETKGENLEKGSTVTKPVEEKKTMTVTVPKASYTYTGKAVKPSVTVCVNGKKIAASKYTVTYSKNKKVGVAKVTVKGKGSYKGLTARGSFKITLKKAALSSVKSSAKKKMTIKWKKDTQADGYQIQYALDKNFKKSVKAKKVSGSKKNSVTISGLKSKKKYYVRIRTYKKVSGNTWYSNWSGTKNIKVK